jgi:multimeric flavodoxin WrbA
MKAYIISDHNYQSPVYEKLFSLVHDFFLSRDFQIEQKSIHKEELHFCIGCYGCWVKKPGECVIDDTMAQINKTFNSSDVVVYLSPIVFGQYSPNIKNAIDRWLPNVLPLFIPKQDGTTGHPQRYADTPKKIIIGYGDTVSPESAQLFLSIVHHRADIDAFIYSDHDDSLTASLEKIKLERIVNHS